MANANLFQQYLRPPKSVLEFGEEMDRAESNRLGLVGQRRQNDLADLTAQQTRATIADSAAKRNAIQEVFAKLGPQATPLERARALQSNPLTAAEGVAAEKAINDAAHVGAQTGKLKSETETKDYELRKQKADTAIKDIAALPNPQAAIESLTAHFKAGDLDEQKYQAVLATIPQDPAQFPAWQLNMLRRIMSAKEDLDSRKLTIQTNNTGGAVTTQAIDPLTGKQVSQSAVPVTQSPDSIASNATQRRGQNMTDARAREANAREVGAAGKPPTGYRFKPDGSLEAIPGGPADIKAGELGAKRERQQQGAIQQADRIISKVDQALKKVGLTSAGVGGSLLNSVPGTEARNLRADLETIKANLGFAELQAMREASPTGGALGAIAVQELIALQSTVASLDQDQGPEQLKQRLGEIRTHYENWKNAVQGVAPASGASGSWDDEKERRYQEWKAKQGQK